MPRESRNQSVVDWAKQNLSQPVRIRLRFATKPGRALVYLLLFSVPFVLVAAMVFLKLSGSAKSVTWWGIFLLGFVLSIPGAVIMLLGARTRQTLLESLDAEGVRSSRGRRFVWGNLRYVDHVSKITRVGGLTRKVEDNQLELVFSDGKAIIPPLIEDRERLWALIDTMPAEVRDDGAVRSPTGSPRTRS